MFKFHEGKLAHSNVHLEVVMDDYMFPAYISPKIRSATAKFEDGMYLVYIRRSNVLTVTCSW